LGQGRAATGPTRTDIARRNVALGRQWGPLIGQPVARPRTRPWIWWLAGGCALLLVIGLVGAGFGVYSLVHSFQSGGLACLPSDFPSYPGATVTSEVTNFGSGVAPGDSKSCHMVLESGDDAATVTAFYNDNLNSADWHVTAFISSGGQIQFNRVSRPATVGVVQLLGKGQQTEIRI
jgi:hypothetical protein